MKLIQNGTVLTPHRTIKSGGVLTENGKILEILERPMSNVPPGTEVTDAAGLYISPGFTDIHVHGGGGLSFDTASPDEIIKICMAHSRYGTTSILPTLSAAPIDNLCSAMDKIAAAKAKEAMILGVFLEGPFFSVNQRGAQALEYIIPPTDENVSRLLDHSSIIRMMGAAPEIPGGTELGLKLARRGITASIAHSDATFEDITKALEYGYTDVTHIYSGCSNVHRVNAYRVAGVVEAGLYFDDLTVQMIADGKHLPPSLLKLIYKCKGADRISLVTDGLAASASDIQEGAVFKQTNGEEVILEDGVIKMMDRKAFAGSCANMAGLVSNMVKLAGVPLAEAVKMASLTPAKVIGLKNKGCLAPGFDADIVLFDEDINVRMTMIRGNFVS